MKENYKCDTCQDTKSIHVKGRWVPCHCLQSDRINLELLKTGIGSIKDPIDIKIKNDPKWYDKSLYLRSKDVKNILMPVLSGIFLKVIEENPMNKCYMTPAFGLIVTYLGKDELHSIISDYDNYAYLAILLNFGDSAPNKLLSQLVRHVIENRILRGKPTFILSDVPKEDLPRIYTEDKKLFEYICEMPDIDLDKILGKIK